MRIERKRIGSREAAEYAAQLVARAFEHMDRLLQAELPHIAELHGIGIDNAGELSFSDGGIAGAGGGFHGAVRNSGVLTLARASISRPRSPPDSDATGCFACSGENKKSCM